LYCQFEAQIFVASFETLNLFTFQFPEIFIIIFIILQVPGGYQMIPAYYHENGGIVMGNMRGLGNATPLRLVSPAPVLVNPGSAGEDAPHWAVANSRTNEAIAFLAGNGVRLLNSQPQSIQTPPASLYSATQPPSLYSSTSGSGTPIGGQYLSLERDL
jgi:hypothetical protein